MLWYVPGSVVISWFVSHLIKEIEHIHTEGKFSLYTLLFKTGGMPSSHSASVSALTTAVFFQEGISVIFWVSLFFSLVVIRDAFGVRKSVSDQAELLNFLVSRAHIKKKVTVVLGHTPVQVTAGIALGIGVAAALRLVWPWG